MGRRRAEKARCYCHGGYCVDEMSELSPVATNCELEAMFQEPPPALDGRPSRRKESTSLYLAIETERSTYLNCNVGLNLVTKTKAKKFE